MDGFASLQQVNRWFSQEIAKYPNENFAESCLSVIKNYPLFSIAGAAGKFTPNYGVWCFSINSELPLIQKVKQICLDQSKVLEAILGEPAKVDLVRICYSHDRSREMSLWHRDGLYWNGQLHITVQGGANIGMTRVREGEKFNLDGLEVIQKRAGDFWYLNSTEYLHKILPDDSCKPRIEITMPVNIPDRFMRYYDEHINDYKDGCFIYTKDIHDLIVYNQKSRSKKVWSSQATPQSCNPYYTNELLDYQKRYFFEDFLKIYEHYKSDLIPKSI